MIKTLTCIYI